MHSGVSCTDASYRLNHSIIGARLSKPHTGELALHFCMSLHPSVV